MPSQYELADLRTETYQSLQRSVRDDLGFLLRYILTQQVYTHEALASLFQRELFNVSPLEADPRTSSPHLTLRQRLHEVQEQSSLIDFKLRLLTDADPNMTKWRLRLLDALHDGAASLSYQIATHSDGVDVIQMCCPERCSSLLAQRHCKTRGTFLWCQISRLETSTGRQIKPESWEP